MTVGELKTFLNTLNDDLVIIAVGTFAAGEEWFQLRAVAPKVDPDTAEDYVQFDLSLLDVFPAEHVSTT